MYKLIAIDVDDTLLNDEMLISDATKTALTAAINQGVHVTLATGRMYASAKLIAQQLNLDVPLITYQGALIKNLLDGETLYERAVPADIAQQLFEYAENHGLHLQVYCDDILYTKQDNERVRDYSRLSNIPYTIEPQLAKLIAKPLTKMLLIDDPEVLDRHQLTLSGILGKRAHITKSKPNFLEIMHSEGTKGHAVSFLADHYGCQLSEVIAIGDSWNDHEMLEVAGLGVAMENAVDSLKKIADYITLSNNHEGVKHVIDTFILKHNV